MTKKITKKIIIVGGSQGITIPRAYFDYWNIQGKILKEFSAEIGKKIILTPIFEKISRRKESEKPHLEEYHGAA